MKKKKIPLFVIIASVGLIVWNSIVADFNNLDKGFWLRLISSILIIISMVLTIQQREKN